MKVEDLSDVRYEVDRGLAWVTIDRPERMNAFRARTVDELIWAFKAAWADRQVGVLCLTGAGDRAFCSGGDQKQRQETGDGGRNPLAQGVPAEQVVPTEFCAWRQRRCVGEVHDENAASLGGVAGHAGLFATAWEVAVLGHRLGWLYMELRLSLGNWFTSVVIMVKFMPLLLVHWPQGGYIPVMSILSLLLVGW